MIELKKNGDIDVNKLTPTELEVIVEMRLAHHKRKLEEIDAK